jgi:formyl-CoA transferase
MLAKADVFIQNLKPGAIAKLGFPIERLRRDYPRLVVCSVSGYGESGPYAQRKAYDMLIQAEAGLAAVTGGPESSASRVGVSVCDIAAGMNSYEAILEALLARGRTGQGADIRVSMFDAMMEWMAIPMLYTEYGAPPKRLGLTHPTVGPYGVFETADKLPILISIQNDREWVSFCGKVLGQPEYATDPRFATNLARVANRPETDGVVARCFAERDVETLSRQLEAAEIAFARVNDVAGILRHPHLRRVTVASPNGPIDLPASPARFLGEEESFGPLPALGEHTERVRREFLG